MSPVADVGTETVILILADVSDYKRFVQLHRRSQAYAERVVCERPDSVIDPAGPPLQLPRICQRFHERAIEMTSGSRHRMCHAFRDPGALRLQVILHHGDAVIAGLAGIRDLIGEDVTLAYRPLRNSILAEEYALATSAYQPFLGDIGTSPSEQAANDARESAALTSPSTTPNLIARGQRARRLAPGSP